jgi:hypothetical protein
MKKFFGLLIFLFCSNIYPVKVTVPKKEKLEEIVTRITCTDRFAKDTKILDIAEEEKEAVGVALAVDSAIYQYIESMKQRSNDKAAIQKIGAALNVLARDNLIKEILKDSPQAIEELLKRKVIDNQ